MAPANAAPLPPWGSAIAGATGAVLANAMVYPLDMFVVCSALRARVALADSILQRQN